jgi:proteasome lid subunit RPN8/RPN11
MLDEARRVPGEECCGLLAGSDGLITAIFPANNALASPSRYEITPVELFRLTREIRAAGLELMGIYHSHPGGENRPSARDIERAYYPDAAYFIVSPRPDALDPIRAFSIRDGRVAELAIQMEEDLSR